MKDEHLAIYNDSLERCTSQQRDFVDRFYELFLASSPDVAVKFENTDFRRQKRALKSSLFVMMLAVTGAEDAEQELARLAHRHRELEIGPGLYEVWLDSLMSCVAEFDPHFSPAVEEAWRAILGIGIERMLNPLPRP